MKRIQLFEELRSVWSLSHKEQLNHILHVISKSQNKPLSEENKVNVSAFIVRARERWNKCHRMKRIFYKNYDKWLEQDFNGLEETTETSGRMGRPSVPFTNMSRRSKQRQASALRASANTDELLNAASSSLYVEGNRDGAKLVREAFCDSGSPGRSKRMKQSWEEAKQETPDRPTSYSPDQALNLMVQAKLTKAQYTVMRNGAREHNAGFLYPSYNSVLEAKKQCYPPQDSISISDSYAEVGLQSLLNLTVDRLLLVLQPVLLSLSTEQLKSMVLVAKWGSDGSAGYSMFKQVSVDLNLNDSALYATSMVPLQLFTLNAEGKKEVLWQCPRPSSPRYCRPIKLEFTKETQQHILHEAGRVQQEIQNLQPHNTEDKSGREVSVTFRMFMTMVDGKLCNVLTSHKSTQSCYVCGVTPSKMNDLEAVVKLNPDTDTYKLGLSPLHGWIRSLEYLIHVSYKLEVRKWQCRSAQDKESVQKRKQEIQKKFKEQLGLNVDVVKQGFGSSNDGNTARTFFTRFSESSSITGLDQDLIERFRHILSAISCGYEIDVSKFRQFAFETARSCVQLYGWYPMPPTIHKILIHGADIIQAAPLPIGMMSEEALESRHKDCKHFRMFNTRKVSRKECNEDMLHMCLITSDPVITSLRKVPRKSLSGPLPRSVLDLLKEPDLSFRPSEASSSDSEEEEEESLD